MTIMCGRLVSGPLMTRKTMTLMLNLIHNRKVTKRNTMKKMKRRKRKELALSLIQLI